MQSSRHRSTTRTWILALYALAYAVAMLALGGATFTQLYAPSPYHRLEADALLKGQLHIGDSVEQIGHDLAWHDGQVNHVWGMGVGLWLTPFEALWRLLARKWFPDRIALGIAFGLLASYSGSAAWRLADATKRPALGIGFAWLITLCPALWTLNQGGRLIYEETSLYGCLVSLGILTALVRAACFGSRRDFFICALLAALSASVRPTHGIYGLAGMLVCSILFLSRRRWKAVLLGNLLFGAGLVFLAVTNQSRFGSPTEFGHRLTATPSLIVFMTRMGNPMRAAGVVEAGRELFGALFLLGDLNKARSAGENQIPGQTSYARWRDPYLTTFDLSWVAVVLAGGAGAAVVLRHKKRRGTDSCCICNMNLSTTAGSGPGPGRVLNRALGHWRRPSAALLLGLVVWSGSGTAALAGFYLRFPNFSVRYLLDFAPALTGFAVLVWLLLPRRWPWLWLVLLAGWLGHEILTAQVRPAPVPLLSRSQIPTGLERAEGRKLESFNGAYSATNHPAETEISYNGYGWTGEDGRAGSIVILAVDRPEFVELLVGPRQGDEGKPAQPDVYRAMMDGQFLPLRQTAAEGDRVRVRFDVPEALRRRAGDELLFLCFSEGFDREDRTSKRMLYSVRWR